MIVDNGKYFVYRHIRSDKNEPFYIGIGKKRENRRNNGYYVDYERAFEVTTRNKIWKDIAKKSPYKVDILLESDDEHFVKAKEKEFISLYGRKDQLTGILANMTDGGDGVFGLVLTEEQKKNRPKPFKGRHHTEESKRRIGLANTVSGSHPENIKRLATINIGRKHNPSVYSERAKKMLGTKRSSDVVKKIRDKRLPIDKKLRIIDMLTRRVPKKHICFLENTSISTIGGIIREYNVELPKLYFREDGIGFFMEQAACEFEGVKPGTIYQTVARNHKCNGFKWIKNHTKYTSEELLKLKNYRR